MGGSGSFGGVALEPSARKTAKCSEPRSGNRGSRSACRCAMRIELSAGACCTTSASSRSRMALPSRGSSASTTTALGSATGKTTVRVGKRDTGTW